ncbi:hypothetical protein PIB30_037434 [Stylosanthes scabra]|uniref:Uncharacterized protein n=1 Tax=Stylosanthes scabra TaxID=79078 RepID=A0ABU6RDR6_9FABA|nr:hypothetical protein [Stylosanthes scabra]
METYNSETMKQPPKQLEQPDSKHGGPGRRRRLLRPPKKTTENGSMEGKAVKMPNKETASKNEMQRRRVGTGGRRLSDRWCREDLMATQQRWLQQNFAGKPWDRRRTEVDGGINEEEK